ncbi:hypothetical protein DICVIV_04891 [Dictyocaulus viviparus]|uniref:Uncharacterized protein n=1 Tax=Dictyocaulus viviparus TaxID=29172 RepID=A0A0D8XYR8_DICVI|nr:hypothetical protein DICVIV_04891 [Dictyocaulus viviparus]
MAVKLNTIEILDTNDWPVSPLAEGKAPSFKVPPTWRRRITVGEKPQSLLKKVLIKVTQQRTKCFKTENGTPSTLLAKPERPDKFA